MNKQLLENKITQFTQSLERLHLKMPDDVSVLLADEDIQDIVIFNLQRVVQRAASVATHILCSKAIIPSSLEDSFIMLEKHKIIPANIAKTMVRSVKIRAIAVHDHTNIDWVLVHSFCKTYLEDFYNLTISITKWHNQTTH